MIEIKGLTKRFDGFTALQEAEYDGAAGVGSMVWSVPTAQASPPSSATSRAFTPQILVQCW